MKQGERFEVSLRKARPKYMPKKLLRHEKIKINERYSFNATVWIADTPESNLKPTVNLVLQHNGDKLRFCFRDTVEMLTAIEELRHFVGGMCVTIHDRHTKAVKEFLDFHEGVELTPINDYTVYTVIQEKCEQTTDSGSVVVDRKTGEIIEEKDGNGRPVNGPSEA